jgi:3-oxoacyl-[acyl-carrier protein] reductase
MARNVIVTGGGSGIGRAVAARFAESGDAVVVTGRQPGPLQATAAELGVAFTVCDASDPAQVEAAELPETVHVLVNNAGGNTDFALPAGADLTADLKALAARWRANLEANLVSAVLMTAAVRDRLAADGSIISIGSIAADKGSGSYGAAKAGLASWNAGLAAELGPGGVTANVVSPGYTEGTGFFRGSLSPGRREALIAATSTGTPASPDDIAGAVHFLASPAARQITGQVLAVNGGARTTR